VPRTACTQAMLLSPWSAPAAWLPCELSVQQIFMIPVCALVCFDVYSARQRTGGAPV
jgi:hypothetical protein